LTVSIPTAEPTQAVSGTNWSWDITDGDYPPSDGWTLSYALRNGTVADALDLTAATSADGDYYEIREVAADTVVTAGLYHWARFVEDESGNRHERARGTVRILPDFAAATTYRTHEQSTLAVLDAAIEGRLTADMEQFTIRGRAVTRIPMPDLMKLRGQYRALVRRQMQGGKLIRQVETRFRAP
jgi:hypothetical protein